ncbi:hypothetical protein NHX12_003137 [Muraenolepis orangiensis]|uniref:Uncharacterized protein n=1 Tax=Muraenolepis orangiensis TaxID=630683 RepID=A0A9Q0E060_9TELE|nr:hypothetical protein NHX12_003137 [Muraenolepis orangiensis]
MTFCNSTLTQRNRPVNVTPVQVGSWPGEVSLQVGSWPGEVSLQVGSWPGEVSLQVGSWPGEVSLQASELAMGRAAPLDLSPPFFTLLLFSVLSFVVLHVVRGTKDLPMILSKRLEKRH